MKSILIYIHFPFCLSKCPYCSFLSWSYEPDFVQLYLQNLIKEIAIWGELLQAPRISTIYIGGGTPSLLSLDGLEKIVRTLEESFNCSACNEFTLEANPDDLVCSKSYLKGLKQMGINRISIGVQSLDGKLLRFLKRRHSAEKGVKACVAAREQGFEQVNMDFLWGVPGQKLNQWLQTLLRASRLGATHLSCYGLMPEPGTLFADEAVLQQMIGEEEQCKMFLYGSRLLEELGYYHYEISNFAGENGICEHNWGYWTGSDYLGLGPSAVSTLKGWRLKNPQTLQGYQERVQTNTQWQGAAKLSREQVKQEMIMLRLRTRKGLSLEQFELQTGENFYEQYQPLLNDLQRHGLIRIKSGYLRFSKKGWLVSDSVLPLF